MCDGRTKIKNVNIFRKP